MSSAEVKRIRPNAAQDEPNSLSEHAILLKEPVTVGYLFQDDYLQVVVVTWTAPSSELTYQRNQKELETKFGPMPQPLADPGNILKSAKQLGPVVIHHLLSEQSGVAIEQVLLTHEPES